MVILTVRGGGLTRRIKPVAKCKAFEDGALVDNTEPDSMDRCLNQSWFDENGHRLEVIAIEFEPVYGLDIPPTYHIMVGKMYNRQLLP